MMKLKPALGPTFITICFAILTRAIEGIPVPGFDRFEFRDPFGNRVELLQRLT
jgi:hypothetical protein